MVNQNQMNPGFIVVIAERDMLEERPISLRRQRSVLCSLLKQNLRSGDRDMLEERPISSGILGEVKKMKAKFGVGFDYALCVDFVCVF